MLVVTNLSDKDQQLKKLLKLNASIESMMIAKEGADSPKSPSSRASTASLSSSPSSMGGVSAPTTPDDKRQPALTLPPTAAEPVAPSAAAPASPAELPESLPEDTRSVEERRLHYFLQHRTRLELALDAAANDAMERMPNDPIAFVGQYLLNQAKDGGSSDAQVTPEHGKPKRQKKKSEMPPSPSAPTLPVARPLW